MMLSTSPTATVGDAVQTPSSCGGTVLARTTGKSCDALKPCMTKTQKGIARRLRFSISGPCTHISMADASDKENYLVEGSPCLLPHCLVDEFPVSAVVGGTIRPAGGRIGHRSDLALAV